MSKPEYFDRQFYRWKVEGKVATIQGALPGAEKTCAQHYAAETDEHRMERIQKAREYGIEIVEFCIAKDGLDVVEKTWGRLGKKLGFKFEVMREEKDGSVFCRLLL